MSALLPDVRRAARLIGAIGLVLTSFLSTMRAADTPQSPREAAKPVDQPETGQVVDLISLATLLFFFGMVTFYAWGVVKQSWVSESRSLSAIEAPLIIPQGLWFAGLVFFVLLCVLLLARGLLAFTQGRYGELFSLIGSKSAVEEAEEEIAAVAHGLEQEKKQ